MVAPEPKPAPASRNRERASIAALNNAWWCRSVCGAHGDPGEIDEALWWHPSAVPRYYPNAVTLDDSEDGAGRLGALFASEDGPWSAKDSFAALDLAPLGCRALFEAQWLWLEPQGNESEPAGWARIATANGLREWERAWDDGEGVDQAAIFVPALLADESVAIWGWRTRPGTEIVAGGIVSHSPGAVGLSNCFSRDPAGLPEAVEALSRLAAGFAPGLPLVGYERPEDCEPYFALGFEAVGLLRIWIKD